MEEATTTLLHVLFALALLAAGTPLLATDATEDEAPRASTAEAWIGVFLGDADDGGVEIIALVPGGPGMNADLRPGDVILRANGVTVIDQASLKSTLRRTRPGDQLRVELLRGGQALETRVEVGLRGTRERRVETRTREPRRFGLRVAEVTPGLRRHFGAPEDVGVLVTRCEPHQLAAEAGVEVGDIVISVDDLKIVSPRQIDSSLRAWAGTRPMELRIVRDGETAVVTVAARSSPEEMDELEVARERELYEQRLAAQIARLEEKLERLRRELDRLQEER